MAKRLWHQSGAAAVQRKYRAEEEILGKPHPIHAARRKKLQKQANRKLPLLRARHLSIG
jgi:hypothetical protein